jgi:hypothetical protein
LGTLVQLSFFRGDLKNLADRDSGSNNGARAKHQQRPKEQCFNRKLQVILACEKISGELEYNSAFCRSRSFYFRNRPLNCDYAHV